MGPSSPWSFSHLSDRSGKEGGRTYLCTQSSNSHIRILGGPVTNHQPCRPSAAVPLWVCNVTNQCRVMPALQQHCKSLAVRFSGWLQSALCQPNEKNVAASLVHSSCMGCPPGQSGHGVRNPQQQWQCHQSSILCGLQCP